MAVSGGVGSCRGEGAKASAGPGQPRHTSRNQTPQRQYGVAGVTATVTGERHATGFQTALSRTTGISRSVLDS